MKQSAMPDGDWNYGRANPARLDEVARLWLGDDALADDRDLLRQTLREAADNPASWWLAGRGGQAEAVLLILRQPGSLATCWLPRGTAEFSPAELASISKRLWSAARADMRERGVRLFQAVAPDERSLEGHLWRSLGFQAITHLLTLCWRPQSGGKRRPGASPVKLSPVETGNEKEFREVLEQTFAETLDTPELERFQSPDEILAGQMHPQAQRWLARNGQGQAVGVLVVSQEKTLGQLNYCGVVASARRQRVGTDLVLWALQQFQLHHVRRVNVRLDARNEPARRLYQGCGFLPQSSEVLFLSE